MATPAHRPHGSDELRQEFLAPAISGDYVACLGVRRPAPDRTLRDRRRAQRRVCGDWVINGARCGRPRAQADWIAC